VEMVYRVERVEGRENAMSGVGCVIDSYVSVISCSDILYHIMQNKIIKYWNWKRL